MSLTWLTEWRWWPVGGWRTVELTWLVLLLLILVPVASLSGIVTKFCHSLNLLVQRGVCMRTWRWRGVCIARQSNHCLVHSIPRNANAPGPVNTQQRSTSTQRQQVQRQHQRNINIYINIICISYSIHKPTEHSIVIRDSPQNSRKFYGKLVRQIGAKFSNICYKICFSLRNKQEIGAKFY